MYIETAMEGNEIYIGRFHINENAMLYMRAFLRENEQWEEEIAAIDSVLSLCDEIKWRYEMERELREAVEGMTKTLEGEVYS